MQPPSKNEYQEWLGHPITEWVLGRLEAWAARQQELWAAMAWEGDLDPLHHREAHVRADCYRAMAEASYEDLNATET